MENTLSFVLSLKELALRRLAINLWSEPDVLSSIEKLSPVLATSYEVVERKVTVKIMNLVIPASLTKQLMVIVKPIGLEIKRWKQFHESFLKSRKYGNTSDSHVEFDAAILAKMRWTASGKLDYQKTANELMLCETLSNLNRYILACLYCLKDFIPHFLEKLPEPIQSKFYNQTAVFPDVIGMKMELCWPYILKGEVSKLDEIIRSDAGNPFSYNLIAFGYVAIHGNKSAIEYFFSQLTDKEKECLYITLRWGIIRDGFRLNYSSFGGLSHGFCYLLSLMPPEKRMDIFSTKAVMILKYFLDWPFQDIFLKVLDLVWDFLSEQQYKNLLRIMHRHFEETGYYLPEFVQKFFVQSPVKFRKVFVRREIYIGGFFAEFFKIQDSDTVKVIFRNIDAGDRIKLMACVKVVELLCDAVLKESWHMVEVCIREARLCKGFQDGLKTVFLGFLKRHDKGRIAWRRRNRIIQLMDEIGASAQTKRCLDGGTLEKTKKHCQ